MASQPALQPYELKGHIFDFADGMPVRKIARRSPVSAPADVHKSNVDSRRRAQGVLGSDIRQHLTLSTPKSPYGQIDKNKSPLLKLAHITQAAIDEAVAQESSPALAQVLTYVRQQCPDAIQAASQQKSAAISVAAVQQAAVEKVLERQRLLQISLDNLKQQEAQVQSLKEEVTSLELRTQSARQVLHGSAKGTGSAGEHPETNIHVLRELVRYMEFLKDKSEAVSKDLEVWFKLKISRKLPNVDDPVKALEMM